MATCASRLIGGNSDTKIIDYVAFPSIPFFDLGQTQVQWEVDSLLMPEKIGDKKPKRALR